MVSEKHADQSAPQEAKESAEPRRATSVAKPSFKPITQSCRDRQAHEHEQVILLVHPHQQAIAMGDSFLWIAAVERFHPGARIARSLTPPNLLEVDRVHEPRTDLSLARRLLAEAGHPKLRITLPYPPDRDTREEEDESYLEDERRMDVMEYESRCEEWEREDMGNEDRVVSPRHDTLNQRAQSTGPPLFPIELLVNGYDLTDLILDEDEYDPYDEETELEARRQCEREMEAEDREEDEDYYPGTFLRDFNPHTDTNDYRLH
jgi:hypothetical protein